VAFLNFKVEILMLVALAISHLLMPAIFFLNFGHKYEKDPKIDGK
jgi:hypothetical protein